MECPNRDPTESAFEDNKQYEYYDVKAADPHAFSGAAIAARPFKADDLADATGNTASKFCLRTMLHWDDKECRLTAVLLTHLTLITLPRWVNVTPEHAAWDKTSAAQLAAHEEGHYLIETAVGRELYAALLAVTPEPTCDALNPKVDQIVAQYAAEAHTKGAEYDKATDHGTKQPGF